jgi:hypothetical protein
VVTPSENMQPSPCSSQNHFVDATTARLCHGNSIKHAWRAEARDASCHSNGILPLCSGFGSEDPKGGSRDEVALKVEGVVDRTMHVEEALGGSS